MGLEGADCPTGKASFPDKASAERTVVFIKKNGRRKNAGMPQRAYRCDHCRYWHLSSHSNDEHEEFLGKWWKK